MTIRAYVTIHSVDLIKECEQSDQFGDLERTYLFAGAGSTAGMPDVDVIVARDFHPNFEHLPQFYDFTVWWGLAHHGQFRSSQMICLQYDMGLMVPDLAERVADVLNFNAGPVAFNGATAGSNWMLRVPGFADAYRSGLKAGVGIDVDEIPPFDIWPTTQGTAWNANDFAAYMEWFTPLFDQFKDHVLAGHLAERSLHAWLSSLGRRADYMPGVIWHRAADLHGTGAYMRGEHGLWQERAAKFGRTS